MRIMSEEAPKMVVKTEIAKPLEYQHLEKSLDIEPFLSYVESYLQQLSGDEGDVSSNSESELVEVNAVTGETVWNGITATKEDRRLDRERYFNFSKVKDNRMWLKDLLLSDSSDSEGDSSEITEEYLHQMLKEHLLRRKYRRKFFSNPKKRQYMYYSTGLLSEYDKFPEHQGQVLGVTKKKKPFVPTSTAPLTIKREKGRTFDNADSDNNFDDSQDIDIQNDICPDPDYKIPSKKKSHRKKGHSRSAEMMAIKRRKLWAVMAKKELGKIQRSKLNNHKEVLTSCRRVAISCMRHWRQKAMQSQKNMKEVVWRAKRLTREMQVYWKRYERVERETRKRMEKEAEEQRKLDIELMEAKRQQRKLNFLITQTELYAHFMSRKLGRVSEEEKLRILSQLEEHTGKVCPFDDYDSEMEKAKVLEGVEKTVMAEETRAREFGVGTGPPGSDGLNEDKPPPQIFRGTLKGYQIKGMTWLANLYDQGINGILADEMGLGKTVQSIAFLCHIAEKYSVWGPFLIISPASTLHNWSQEIARFVPDFKVVPYWGNQQDRKILRTFWDQKGIHTKEASFHVVVTSYQLVIMDIKYFNRIKWQYMILDEAQAIKSSSSMRWKLLLGFHCRNRLLLSGTPIQNSMAELWALLHFIMPTMFDCHDEFNEWFSKDIESHVENKTGIDEKHLSRLHMILKPFMLRRVKADVENELSDKIEIMVYCPLTIRQQCLYAALKKKIRIEDLLHSSGPYQSAQSITSNLMNLVMQFRKVCNHPDLFERREPRSPYYMKTEDYLVPRLVIQESIHQSSIPSFLKLLLNIFSIFHPYHTHSSLFHNGQDEPSNFSFMRLLNYSPMELYRVAVCGYIYRWLDLTVPRRKRLSIAASKVPEYLVFTDVTTAVYAQSDVTILSTPETLEHRVMRSRKIYLKSGGGRDSLSNEPATDGSIRRENQEVPLIPEFIHRRSPPQVLPCCPVTIPVFLRTSVIKVASTPREMYASWRRWVTLWRDRCDSGGLKEGKESIMFGSPELAQLQRCPGFLHLPPSGLQAAYPPLGGWSPIFIPDRQILVTDAGKLTVLDGILKRLKQEGHRVLIYSQMTRMIDLLEEYMWYRKLTYMRLDGSSKISDRRDMVDDFQNRSDIFVFLLTTRAGGLGINLTAADTVIFYDSDWNPTVDQQAMDRAHRLGQTKQVTVYRLICKDTIEERILQRAREKSEIQRMVISGSNFKPDALKPKEVVSLLLDDAEIEQKYRQKKAERERRLAEELKQDKDKERKRKQVGVPYKDTVKHIRTEDGEIIDVFQRELDMSDEMMSLPLDGDGKSGGSSSEPIGKLNPERGKGKRGRPPRGARRGLTRPTPFSHMPPIALNTKSVGLVGGVSCKSRRGSRGRGRPRLKASGPGHHNNRSSSGAAQSSLHSVPPFL